MSLPKRIEINQSSFLGLKAELLRKKNEVSNAKYSQEIKTPHISKKKLKTKLSGLNEGVNEREKRDLEEIQEESNILKKSHNILEEKAKLYDKLVTGSDSTVDTSGFLVNFKQKTVELSEDSERNQSGKDNCSNDLQDDYSDDDEWIDFVDCLGRTKRCHKDDLEVMKEKDAQLKRSLGNDIRSEQKESENSASLKLPELCSEDMKRELLREKWEEQERNLLDKKNVHYQDVLFDEARTHGVGYYEFSTDEAERARQQEELKNLRKETEKRQKETRDVALNKKRMMAERLRAARRRKRERLGLPPEEEDTEKNMIDEEEEEKKPEPPEELRRDVRKPGPVRLWDIGKESSPRVLSQEEWNEKKRAERNDEFAPPKYPQPVACKKKTQIQKDGFGKKSKGHERAPMEVETDEKSEERGKGVEIPPPLIFDMYTPNAERNLKKAINKFNQAAIDKSIEEGLSILRKEVEEKQSRLKRRRDEDIEIM